MINQLKKFLRRLATVAVLACIAPYAQAATYNVSFDGAAIDLFGTIETSTLGTFSSAMFGAQVTDYSITASLNGASAFNFNSANSAWGGHGFGDNVSVTVTTSSILLSAPGGGDLDGGNLFLTANVATAGALENLRIFDGNLGFRPPIGATPLAFEQVGAPFELASTIAPVPEPETYAMMLAGLGLLGFFARRRKQAAA